MFTSRGLPAIFFDKLQGILPSLDDSWDLEIAVSPSLFRESHRYELLPLRPVISFDVLVFGLVCRRVLQKLPSLSGNRHSDFRTSSLAKCVKRFRQPMLH